MTLYYITAYRHSANEWWRFAVSGTDEADALARFKGGYDDVRLTRVNARAICPVNTEVFEEL